MPKSPFPCPTVAAPVRGGRVGRLMLVLLAPLWWLLLLDINTGPLGPGLDPSYSAVMAKYLAERAHFGADITFNYGPLAPLAIRVFDARIYGLVFAGELLLKGALVVFAVRLTWDVPGWRRWLLPLAILAAPADWQVHFFLLAAGAGFLLVGRTRLDRWLTLPALALLAVLALVKGTLLVLAGLAVALGALACGWTRGWRPAAARLVGFALVLGALWRALGQRWGDLPAFVTGTLDIAGGYSRGLALPVQVPAVLPLGLAAAAVVVLQTGFLAAFALRRDRAAGPMALLLMGTLFLAWKQGFTRADGHVAEFFNYALASTALGPLFLAAVPNRPRAWAHGLGFAAALGLGVTGDVWAAVHPEEAWNILRNHWNGNPAMLADPRAHAQRLKAAILGDRQRFALPRIRKAVRRETVDCFGYEQGMAIVNGLNYTPPPVCQGYQANTPLTQRLNQDFYRGPRAPEFVMFKLQPIDGHPPGAENAGVLATLLLDYAPVLAEEEFLLLRRVSPRTPTSAPLPLGRILAEGELGLGDTLPVPTLGADELVWCELDLRESRTGWLLATVFHQMSVQMEVEFTDGRPAARHRLVPPMVRTGFLLSPGFDSAPGFVTLQAGREDKMLPTVRGVRLVNTDPALAREFQPRWGYRLRTLPPPGPAVRDAAAAFLDRRGFDGDGGGLTRYGDVAAPPPTRVRSDSAAVERFPLDGTTFVLVHATGEMEWDLPPGRTRVRGRFGMRPNAWEPGLTDGAEFRVEFLPPGEAAAPTVLLTRLLRPREIPADRAAQDFDLPLPPGADATGGRLILRTLPGPEGAAGYDFTGWGGVRIE